jgi:hypothetical protein
VGTPPPGVQALQSVEQVADWRYDSQKLFVALHRKHVLSGDGLGNGEGVGCVPPPVQVHLVFVEEQLVSRTVNIGAVHELPPYGAIQ